MDVQSRSQKGFYTLGLHAPRSICLDVFKLRLFWSYYAVVCLGSRALFEFGGKYWGLAGFSWFIVQVEVPLRTVLFRKTGSVSRGRNHTSRNGLRLDIIWGGLCTLHWSHLLGPRVPESHPVRDNFE